MKAFTKLAAALIIVSFFFIGCKKSKDTPSYYFKFKKDGTWITFKTVASELGADLSDPTKTNFTVAGDSDDDKQTFDISFQVDGSDIPTGTYSSDDHFMPVNYFVDFGTQDFKAYSNDAVDGMPAPHFTVTLTSISESVIRGSFTGNYVSEFSTEEVIEITEGEFVAPRIR
jgi:hypothetical protein